MMHGDRSIIYGSKADFASREQRQMERDNPNTISTTSARSASES